MSTSTRQRDSKLTQVFSGGLTAEKSVGSFRDLSKLSSNLQHLLMASGHCFWREPGGILCTFISEGRMFSMLERLDPMSHKGEDRMITSDSFVLEIGNNMKNVLDLFATRSLT